jgi:YgiT-type zinc finger domain-containing protein
MDKKEEKKAMKCPVCEGKLKKQIITHEEWWDDSLYVFKDVPALVCESCGDISFTDEVSEAMDRLIQSKEEPEEYLTKVPVFSLKRKKRVLA